MTMVMITRAVMLRTRAGRLSDFSMRPVEHIERSAVVENN
jgi:hypothetical protein